MESLSNKRKVLEAKPLTLMEKAYLPAIAKGMGITMKHFIKNVFGKGEVTIRYPEQKREFSENFRGMHSLKRDEEGRERCTACGLCALSCPAEAITMTAAERQAGEEHLYREEKYAAVYEINMLRCIFCGLCEEACPKEAIYLDGDIVPTDFVRKDFIYGKDKLVEAPLNQ
ncbi:NuoI/complex I 23 kDa subunit family protein [Mucilaginibacter sp. KACC 22063]|uniref:NuoI/complex I 23 kDa subunit family protein n=1 Tax=Mucilaginibacter sp. KACC 22063 TaxID=3025666 RepID=UPI002365A4B2|nr:NADH-quinone oxidoreductase subunit I [Mucilaginibacter sp. KACC 22063]WDF55125.1 NADH-quinone oxidoreductase subunit I [Mucilaginibacter sp. KACC 22063]